MKEGIKVHTGKVAGFGNKAEIEKLMLDLDTHGNGDDEQETAVGGEQGTVLLLYT